MTIQQLLNCSAEQLEALSDSQLEEYFKPYFNVTRPDRAMIKQAAEKSARRNNSIQKTFDPRLMALMNEAGVDIDEL